ncbi:hypothetical protein ACP6PL_28505 [Dapis sp. BLCC M126]
MGFTSSKDLTRIDNLIDTAIQTAKVSNIIQF